MPVLRFRVYLEDDDQIYRDIEIQTGQTFFDFHQAIVKAFEFDGKHEASFFESNDRWLITGREISSEILVNKKDAPALSMMRTPVSALVSEPEQKFTYVYDRVKKWSFLIELVGIDKLEMAKRTYPFVLRKEGVSPAQYGVKGINRDKLIEVEEKYDLSSDEMAEGFSSDTASEGSSEEQGGDSGASGEADF